MMQSQVKIKVPQVLLIVSLILTIATILYFSTIGWSLYTDEKQVLAKLASVEKLSKQISHLDEVLTMSARLNALTGEKNWQNRYMLYEPELELAIKKALSLSSSIDLKRFLSEIKTSNDMLVAMERKSFFEVREGRFKRAKEILFSEEYLNQKSIYANGVNNLLKGVTLEAKEKLEKYEQLIRNYFLIALIIILVIWVSIFFIFWRYFTKRKLAEEMLRTSEERLGIVTGLSYDFIWERDIASGACFWFGNIDAYLGYDQNGFPRTIDAWKNIVHPDDRERVKKSLDEYPKGHVKWHEEYRIIKKDGCVRDWEDRGETIYGENGKPIVIGAIRDITEQRKGEVELKQHREHLEELVEEKTRELELSFLRSKSYFDMPLIGSVISNLEKGFVDVNKEMCRITGCSRDELLKKSWAEITHPEDLQSDIGFFKELISGVRDTYSMEKRYIRKNGSIIAVEIFVSCVRKKNGEIDYFVAMVQDISERKKLESEREKLAQLKTEFLSTVAHELRTPLTSILGFSELMRDRDNLSRKAIKQYSESINEESNNLASIINELLDISKIEAGKNITLKMQLFNLIDCVNREIELFSHQNTGHEFPVEIHGDSYEVLVDPGKVQQVLRNLYSNSIKYSEAVSKILTKVEFEDEVVSVSVSDIGKGMTQEQVAHIFDKFYRTEEVKNIQGTGLGMGIVKHLVESHAGRVWVNSELGKGTTIKFELPRYSPVWREEFSVKIPSLDNQHKELFNLTRKLANSIRIGAKDETPSLILNELLKYAEFHFKYEEDFFHKYDYVDTAKHIKSHRQFQNKINGFKYISERANPHLSLRIVSFLYNWLTSHILKEDMAYSLFLEQRMLEREKEF